MPGEQENKQPDLAGGEQPGEISEPPVGVPVEINAHDIEPGSQMPGGEYFEETAVKTNYIIIQSTQSPNVEQQRQLREMKFCSQIPPYTWTAKYEPQDLTPIRELQFAVFANPFHESLSLDPGLEAKLEQGNRPRGIVAVVSDSEAPEELHEVIIKLHPLSRTPEEMRAYLASSHYGIPRERIFLGMGMLSASLTAEQILRVAKIDDVQMLDAVKQARLHIGEPKHTGKDQIIVIADSGLSKGILVPGGGSLEVTDPIHSFFNCRVKMLDPRSDDTGTHDKKEPTTRVGKSEDLSGHGTHVAATALGSYGGMKSKAEINLTGTRLDGVATGAVLIMQNTLGCPVYDASGKLISAGKIKLANRDHKAESLSLDPYYMYPDPTCIPTQPLATTTIMSKLWSPKSTP
ncbi:hypothetical protein V8F33_011134 [Rhypophila sp. PSN 637]